MNTNTVGVIVARFQTTELHAGHRFLLDEVSERHPKMLVVLGSPQTWVATVKNPLDFATRRELVLRAYPNALIAEARDNRSNAIWSAKLDRIIREACPGHEPVLYGSRDSFLSYYTGKARRVELPPVEGACATDVRTDVTMHPSHTADFRAGAIYAAAMRPPIVYQAVDIAIIDRDRKRVLLGRKVEEEGRLRFIGGFVDTTDSSLEAAAKREAYEETSGLEIADLRYLGSERIDDWRYRKTSDRLMTAFFVATYVFGHAQASDDLDGLEWVDLDSFETRLVEAHHPLGALLRRAI